MIATIKIEHWKNYEWTNVKSRGKMMMYKLS